MQATSSSTSTHWISEPRQIAVVASGVRQEICDAVAALGPCSIAEVAVQLDGTPHALYHHFRILVQAGLLRESGTRQTGSRAEALYTTPARKMALRYDPSDPENVASVTGVVSAMSRVAVRDFRRAFEPDIAVVSGPRRNLWAARATGWLTSEELQELNTHLRALMELFTHRKPPKGRKLYALTWLLAPLRQP